MDHQQYVAFLFDMSKEFKHFYETPVIYLTQKDYSDDIFNTMCRMRSLLYEKNTESKLIDNIVDFHLNWLHAVNEIENFKKIINELPRENIYQAISYTIDSMSYRLKYYHRYMENNKSPLTNVEQANLSADIEIVEDMHKDVARVLLEKLKCFRNFTVEEEFQIKVFDAAEELLHWLDKIYDSLSRLLSNYININVPHLSGDLTKTLQQIVDGLQKSKSPSALKLLENMKMRGRQLSSMIRCTNDRSLEISKVIDKINVLDERIRRLEHEPTSAAVMALKHKKEYLEGRLNSLENLKTSIKSISTLTDGKYEDVGEEELCVCPDFYTLRIFNHALPVEERERLVTELCYLWDVAVFGEKDTSHKSIISILSAAEMREEFTDELGTFYIDEHSRKIYKMPNDDTLYQPNENNELVPLADDAEHFYYYDECGRYYLDNKTRQRVYKDHASASEYMMDSTGVLLKIKEERDGITYYYDNYGRYYIDQDGKHIYREADATSEYEHDGLGNLVRIRSHFEIFDPCSDDVNVTEDFKYLKRTVGQALRECIANVIMLQPPDPIKYLSTCLVKYRENLELKEKRATEKEQLNAEREYKADEDRAAEERAAVEAALLIQGGSETSYDTNMVNYMSMPEDDNVTPVTTTTQ